MIATLLLPTLLAAASAVSAAAISGSKFDERATHSCAVTADCAKIGYTLPSNSHYLCVRKTKKCGWACNSNFVSRGSRCVKSSKSKSSSKSSSKPTSKPSATSSATRAVNPKVTTSAAIPITGFPGSLNSPASSSSTSSSASPAGATAPAATPVLKKEYSGANFFNGFWFLNQTDPTNGMVNYVNSDYAYNDGLASISPSGTAILSIDRTTELQPGEHRDSVRISSYDTFDAGNLLIFDVKHVPVGCSAWPAIWMFNYPWPDYGEIDIYEGVNNRAFNQMTLHTSNGCTRNPNIPQSGSVDAAWASNNCYAYSSTYGCQVMDWDPKSYGAGFNAAGGGVWAVMFAETGISMWRWSRSAIPSDVTTGAPRWKTWGIPVAAFDGSTCDTRTFFKKQMITFDITTCGDWAGLDSVWQDPLQSGSTCYPKYKNCAAAVQDPSAFSEAYFEINSIKVFSV